MKQISLTSRLVALALGAAFVLAPLTIRADSSGPTVVSDPDLFAYQAPAGWTVGMIPGASYTSASDVKNGAPQALITIEANRTEGPLEDWMKGLLARNAKLFGAYNYHAGDPTQFLTDGSIRGFRVVSNLTANGKALTLTVYYFAGTRDAKIAVTCTCSDTDAAHYAPIFDAAMKTFMPY